MPFVDDFTGTGFVNTPPIPTEDNKPEVKPGEQSLTAGDPTFGAAFGAEFEQNNIVGSLFYDEDIRHRFSEYDPAFNLGDELNGTGFENAPELFVSARNRDHLHALISDVQRERNNRTIIEQSSWGTWLPAMVTAQLADPINLLSLGGGAAAKFAGKAGYSLLSRSAIAGVGIGVDTAAQEAILQGSQQDRSTAETVGNIGGSVVLGGILGYGVGRLIGPAEHARISEGIERDLGNIPGDQAPDPFDPGTFRGNLSGEGASLSAAMVEGGADDMTLKSAFGVEKLLKGTSPLSRTMLSDSKATRLTVNELAESPYIFNENAQGVEIASQGSRMGTPGTVETRVKTIYEYPMAISLQEIDRQFIQYRLGRVQQFGDKMRLRFQDSGLAQKIGGAADRTVLSEKEFREAIYDAINQGGEHPIAEVKAAAAYVQRKFLDLIQAGAAETGVAKQALPRSYLVGRILADLPRFREIVIAHLKRERIRYEGVLDELSSKRSQLNDAAEAASAPVGGETASASDKAAEAIYGDPAGLYRGGAFSSLDNASFYRAYMAKVDEALRVDAEKMTPEMDAQIRSEVLKAAYGDDVAIQGLLDSENPAARGIGEAMRDAAGDMVQLREAIARGEVDPALDITPLFSEIAATVDKISRGRVPSRMDPAVEAIIRTFYDTQTGKPMPADRITEVLRHYAQEAKTGRTEGATLDDVVAIGRDRAARGEPSSSAGRRNAGRSAPGGRGAQAGQAADAGRGSPGDAGNAGVRAQRVRPTAAENFAASRAMDEDAELADLADEIIRRMTNKQEGRMSYDMHRDIDSDGFETEGARLRPEDFDLPYADVRDYVERDIEINMRMMRHGLAPDIEIARRFGSADMREPIKKIQQEYQRKMRAAATEAERLALGKKMMADVDDIRAMRDRIAGRYGLPDDPAAWHVKWPRIIRDYNVATKLGSVLLSSASDAGKLIWSRGVGGVFGDLLLPMMRNWGEFMGAMDDVKMAGTALDVVLDSRAMAFAEGTADFGGQTRIDRFSRESSKAAMRLAGMTHWNAGMKQLAGVLASKNILESAQAVAAGTATRKQITLLARGGISTENAVTIAEQFAAHGKREGGVWRAEAGSWGPEAKAAREAFLGAIRRDVDTLIVTPGQELPLFMSREGMKFFTQFKSFGASSMHRTLIAGLQQRDFNVFMGMFTMFTFAMMANEAHNAISGKEQKPFAERWADSASRNQMIIEAVDRAGIFGWFGDINNVLDKAAGAGLSNAFGTGEYNTRYGVTLTDQLAGPGVGTIDDIGKIASAVVGEITGRKEWKESDTRRLRRQIPFIGVFYIRSLLDQIGAEEAFNDLVNAEAPSR